MSERPFRVVLVEDNDDDADLVARGARRFGPKVRLVRLRTIPDAIDLLKQNRLTGEPVDLVLIDGKIDGVGADVFFELAKPEGLLSIPCVVLKGCVDAKADAALRELGARQVRSKPVDYTQFQEEIAEILVAFCPPLGTQSASNAPDEKN